MFKNTHSIGIIKYKKLEFQIFKNLLIVLIGISSIIFAIAFISRPIGNSSTNSNIEFETNEPKFVENPLYICESIKNSEEKIQCINSVMKKLSLKRKEEYQYENEKLISKDQILNANNSDDFGIDLDRGYWHGLAAEKHHLYDPYFAQAMVDFFNDKKAHFLADFGAGLGKYAGFLVNNGFFVTCLDGNPRTQDLSYGRCSTMDLSKPVRISSHDWVISLEVGEHIPPEFESTFLQNLDRANKYGLILSWAIKGQWGDGHFNNQNNSYIIQKLETEYKYKFDQVSTDLLRSKTSFQHFRNTVMVFRKEQKLKENLKISQLSSSSTSSILDLGLSWLNKLAQENKNT